MSIVVSKNQILDVLEKTFAAQSTNRARFFHQLQQTRRVQSGFHVTLIHRASAKQHPELWEKYTGIHEEAGSAENKLGSCQVQLERVISAFLCFHIHTLSYLPAGWNI
jgi:tRNA ligase